MAISRAQIPEQIDVFENGGEASIPSSLTPEDIINIYGAVQAAPVSAADIQAQQEQIAGLFPQPRKANFFDLASEVGAGLVAGAAAPGGFGVGLTAGLQSFNEVAQKRRAEADKIRQEMAVLAYKQVEARRQEQLAQSKEILQMQFKAALEGQSGSDFGGSERGKALAFIARAEKNPSLKTVPDPDNPGKMKPNPDYTIALLIAKQERIVQTETGQIRIPGIDIEGAFDSAGVAGPKVIDGKTYTPVPGQTEKGTGKQIYEDSDGNKVVLD
tara:strand:- start:3248 stop:4060 length:813 start_codon:yes stop_codon:yes gene_type:complete